MSFDVLYGWLPFLGITSFYRKRVYRNGGKRIRDKSGLPGPFKVDGKDGGAVSNDHGRAV